MSKRSLIPAALLTAVALAVGACTASASGADKQDVVDTYAEIAYASYSDARAANEELASAVHAFTDDPSEDTLEAAKDAWLIARDVYIPTEIFRFYGGPIDNEETGVEGLVNAWPMDEAYVDYVEGDPDAGIINNPDEYPEITADVLVEANEQGGEENVSTGYHCVEFLLWGQDTSSDGPGDRPHTDFVDGGTAANQDRRREYLNECADLLVEHLGQVTDEWAPDADNYRAEFVADEPDASVARILIGMGNMSGHELSSERMAVALDTRDQEDEHSCFSDNTHADLVGNAVGVQMVWLGEYGHIDGPGMVDLVEAQDPEIAEQLTDEIDASVAAVEAIPAPFDQVVTAESDDDPGRVAAFEAVEALEVQTETIEAAADSLELNVKFEVV